MNVNSFFKFFFCAPQITVTMNNLSHILTEHNGINCNSAYKTINLIAISAAIPGIPSNPETAAVTKLIGMCNSNAVPKTLTKKSIRAPIITLVNPCPIKRNILLGAPINKSKQMIPVIKEITNTGANIFPLLYLSTLNIC
jgi:hypothetical protein